MQRRDLIGRDLAEAQRPEPRQEEPVQDIAAISLGRRLAVHVHVLGHVILRHLGDRRAGGGRGVGAGAARRLARLDVRDERCRRAPCVLRGPHPMAANGDALGLPAVTRVRDVDLRPGRIPIGRCLGFSRRTPAGGLLPRVHVPYASATQACERGPAAPFR